MEPEPPAEWTDPLRRPLIWVTVVLAVLSLPFWFLGYVGYCWEGCDKVWEQMLPAFVLVVPIGFGVYSARLLRRRRRRALRSPTYAAWAKGTNVGLIVATVVVVGLLLLFGTCFTLLGFF